MALAAIGLAKTSKPGRMQESVDSQIARSGVDVLLEFLPKYPTSGKARWQWIFDQYPAWEKPPYRDHDWRHTMFAMPLGERFEQQRMQSSRQKPRWRESPPFRTGYVRSTRSYVSSWAEKKRLLSNFKESQIGRAREVFARKNAKTYHQPETANQDTYRGPEQRTSTMFRSQPSNPVPITRQTVNFPIESDCIASYLRWK